MISSPVNSTSHSHHTLKFLTAGNVDDGKSTLIGRLLLDSKAILADQLSGIQQQVLQSMGHTVILPHQLVNSLSRTHQVMNNTQETW